MLNLSQNELEQITEMRRLKNYNYMSKEELLIALLKSNQSLAELQKSKSYNVEIEENRKLFNELKNRFSKNKKIREKFHEREKINRRENILKNEEKKTKKYQDEKEKKYKKEQEKKQGIEKSEKKNTLKRTEKILKNLGEHVNTIKKHLDRDNDDPDYKGLRKIESLFSKVDEEDYYKPVKSKSAFNDNYIEYESRGDEDKDLSPE